MPSIFTLQGPSFGHAGAFSAPSNGGMQSVLVLGGDPEDQQNLFGLNHFGNPGETVSINPGGGTITVNGQLFQVALPAGPFVDSMTWLGTRPPSPTEQQQIASCKNTWGAYGSAAAQYGTGAPSTGGACFKTNFTLPAKFQNFYRDNAVEKLWNPTTGEVMIVKNDPSWIATKLNDLLKYCNYAAVASGVAYGPGASAAASAGCAVLTSGTPPGGGPVVDDGTPGFKEKTMSTGAKVAIGVGGAGVLAGIALLVAKLLK